MLAKHQLLVFSLLLLASIALFLLLGFDFAIWEYILELRLTKLLGLVVVAFAVGISTLLFQTITQNPILTPSILGFDALFILLQTVLILILGSSEFIHLNAYYRFALEVAVMVSASLLLFNTLIKQGKIDIVRMVLIGAVFGILFKSLSSFIHRLIDPNDFLTLQVYIFASFNSIKTEILPMATIITFILLGIVWHWRDRLDIMMLGRKQAINLGIHYDRFSYQILIIISILIAVATSLVGPVNFFGLLVVAIVNKISRTFFHRQRLPMLCLLSAIILIAGQTLFEHIFNLQGTLSIVIDFVGGLTFLWLLNQQRKRQI